MTMQIVVLVALALLGACLGSFAGATVWRLRARQLAWDKKHKEPVDEQEYRKLLPLTKPSVHQDRSRCLHCGQSLKWYELIPIVSWLALGGKCRHCHQPIGLFELLIEVGVAAFFIGSYVFWPFGLQNGFEIAHFVIWLIAGVILAMLFAYDSKWYLLPDKLTLALGVVGVATLLVTAPQSPDPAGSVLSSIASIGILSGLYLVLYVFSKGKWIGFGDVKLGFGLALLLGDWQLALIALFLANFIGCLVVLPLLIAGKLKRNAHVPFGPLLIAGMIAAQFIGPLIVQFYVGTLI